jgi:hypothetical protein
MADNPRISITINANSKEPNFANESGSVIYYVYKVPRSFWLVSPPPIMLLKYLNLMVINL